MSDRKLGLALMWFIPFIFTLACPFSVGDLGAWIQHGLYFLDHHEILKHDIYSVLPTSAMVYPTWGISIIYALIYKVSNLTAVCLFHAVLVMGILLGMVYQNSLLKLKNPNHPI